MDLVNANSNPIFNLVDYCDNKISKHEDDTGLDLNFFNNVQIPQCDYLDLDDTNSYFSKLKNSFPFNILHCNCRSFYNKLDEPGLPYGNIGNTKLYVKI